MKKPLFLVLITFFVISCDDVEDIVNELTPNLTPAQVMGFADSSLESAGSAFSGPQFSARQTCDSLVSDVTTDTAGLTQYLACMLNENSQSPDTMRGSFHVVNEVMNLLDGQISFEYDSSFTAHENISGTVNVSEGVQDVTVSIREGRLSTDWDFHVQVCILSLDGMALNTSLSDCENGTFTFEVFLVVSFDQIGFRTVSSFGSFTGGTSYILDIENQQLRFEAWDEEEGRHQRLFVQGAISSDFELDSVSQVTIAVADPGIEDMGDGTDAVFADYDGTNLCAGFWDDEDNDHSNGFGDGDMNTPEIGSQGDLTLFGTCSTFPVYDGGFFTSSAGLESYLRDENNPPLSFDSASFSISSYFIQ